MHRAIMLNATSPMEMFINKTLGAALWKAFKAGGTSHSKSAATLPYIIRRCEKEGVAYVLHARPGEGYYIQPEKKWAVKQRAKGKWGKLK